MQLKKTAVALALGLGMVAGVSAASYTSVIDYGAIAVPSGLSDIITHGTGSFVDQLKFSVTTPTLSAGWVADMQFGAPGFGTFDITGLSVQLYTEGGTLLNNLDSSPLSTADYKFGSGVFLPGNYYFTVSGVGAGSLGGQYTFYASTLAPVPEPEAYAMLLAGLGLIGGIVRRRKLSGA